MQEELESLRGAVGDPDGLSQGGMGSPGSLTRLRSSAALAGIDPELMSRYEMSNWCGIGCDAL